MADPQAPTRELGSAMPGVSRIAPWATLTAQTSEHVTELRWPRSVQTYERMLSDAQVWGLYSGTVMPLLDYRWWIDPNGVAADDPYLAMLAEDVGLPIGEPAEGAPEPVVPDEAFDHGAHLLEALFAPIFGHYYFELTGEIREDVWRLRDVAPRPPSTLAEVNPNPDGTLRSIRQSGVAVSQAGSTLFAGQAPEIPARQLVAYVWWPASQSRWLGRSILRPIYRSWLCKDVLIRVDVTNHDRAGGVPYVETDERFQGQSLEDLQRLASEFRVDEDGGAALPPGAILKLARVGGTDVVGSVRYHDEQMATVWQAMVRTLAQTPNGSRALGGTFADLETMARRAMAGWYARRFTRTVLGRWWRWNVTGADRYSPMLRFTPPAVEGVSGPALEPGGGGGPDPPVAATGRPSPRGGAGAPQTDARAARGAGARGAASAPASGAGVRAAGDEAAALPSRPLAELRSRAPVRETRRGLFDHEVQAATDFQALEVAYTTAAQALDDHYLQDWLPAQLAELGDAITYTRRGTPRQRVTRADLARITASAQGAERLAEVLAEVARAGAAEAVAELTAQGEAVSMLAEDELAAVVADHAGAVASLLAEGVSVSAQRRAVQLVGERTAAQIAADVQSHVGGLAHRWERDQLAGAVQMAQTGGRMAVFDRVPSSRAVGFYSSELLDSRTCEQCRAIDGRNYPDLAAARMDYPTGGYLDCAGGPRCRGTVVAVLADEV